MHQNKKVKIILACFLFLSLSLNAQELIIDSTSHKGAYNKSTWITELIDSNASITSISIPGTHNSGTAGISPWNFKRKYAQCQSEDISSQLNLGIRFLDIRLRKKSRQLNIFHGTVNCRSSFSEALNQCRNFLKVNPGEFIIMSVKQENGKILDETWINHFNKDSLFYFSNDIDAYPKVKDIRGKIVLLIRFSANKKINGFNITNLPNNSKLALRPIVNYPKLNYYVQDYYNVKLNQLQLKKDAINECITHSLSQEAINSSGELYLNFISMVGIKCVLPYPSIAAEKINYWLNELIATKTNGNYGCVIMDFPSNELITKIINSNI